MPRHTILVPAPLVVERLDRALEAAVLLAASEAGYARDYRNGPAFGVEKDGRRLEAFALGMLDTLSGTLGQPSDVLPLLVYLRTLLEHGPGGQAREVTSNTLGLANQPELSRYRAGGRRLVLRMQAGRAPGPGLFASLLEEELQET